MFGHDNAPWAGKGTAQSRAAAGKDKHVEVGCIVQGFWLIGVRLLSLPDGENYSGVYQANFFV
jgi:hypothetical protein